MIRMIALIAVPLAMNFGPLGCSSHLSEATGPGETNSFGDASLDAGTDVGTTHDTGTGEHPDAKKPSKPDAHADAAEDAEHVHDAASDASDAPACTPLSLTNPDPVAPTVQSTAVPAALGGTLTYGPYTLIERDIYPMSSGTTGSAPDVASNLILSDTSLTIVTAAKGADAAALPSPTSAVYTYTVSGTTLGLTEQCPTVATSPAYWDFTVVPVDGGQNLLELYPGVGVRDVYQPMSQGPQ